MDNDILMLATARKKEIDDLMDVIRTQSTYMGQLEQDADKFHLALCCGDKKIYINRLVSKDVYDIEKGAILEDIKAAKDEMMDKLNSILNPEPVVKEVIKEVEVVKEVEVIKEVEVVKEVEVIKEVEKLVPVTINSKMSKSTMSPEDEKKLIYRLWIEEGFTTEEIAIQMGLTRVNINDRIKKYNIKIPYSKNDCQRFIDKGLSARNICGRFGLTVNELKTKMVSDKLSFNQTP